MSKRTFEAWRGGKLFETGMAQVVICRHKPGGDTEAGVFLLDIYCLGVKNAFYTAFATSRLGEILERVFQNEGREALSPACGRKLVEDSTAYARRLGFAPHPDYKHAARVLGGIDARDCQTEFKFGFEGKPLYVAGPNDSPRVQELVLATLRRLGEGNYHFIIGGPAGGNMEDQPAEEAPPPAT